MNGNPRENFVDGNTKLFGVIGNPIRHSFSPDMQTKAFQALNINAVYLPFLIEENHLPDLLNAFKITGVQGFNVTVPYKERIIPYLDCVSEGAKSLGSVNTVKLEHGKWKGFSTDGLGFVRSLENAGISLKEKRILLVGAGGAGKAIALSLIHQEITEITILNRTKEKSDKLKSLIKNIQSDLPVFTSFTNGSGFDILINSTSVGMKGNQCPVTDEMIEMSDCIIDIIYNPPQTPLIKKALNKGIPCMNGIDMLLYQGVESFEIWTGQKAPVNVMNESLVKSLKHV